MKINYRILSVDEKENSIVVRYWTDILTEEFLSTEFSVDGKPLLGLDGKPIRCRTDFNISLFDDYNLTELDVIARIERSAPVAFLKNLEYVESRPDKKVDMSVTSNLLGVDKSFDVPSSDESSNNVFGII
jgi:hypothetical protein